MPDTARDAVRRAVSTGGLTPAAVAHLTRDALGTIDFSVLAPVKKLLKQFFSAEPWTAADDDALADLVGAGAGWWRYALDDDFEIEFGWRAGAFRIELAGSVDPGEAGPDTVVAEATPNPRTMRFVTPPMHDGPSRWYASAAGVDDPRVARLFAEFDDVANVLVGPDFVAVGLHRPDRWQQLLESIRRMVASEFATPGTDRAPTTITRGQSEATPFPTRPEPTGSGATALERAWKELGALHPDVAGDLQRILAATTSTDSARRQVAARKLADADPAVALTAWDRLLDDPSRSVRRATVDVMVDTERPALRPTLERALADTDAWTRWKALRGLVGLGVGPSRAAVSPLAHDPDFRVRLEVANALPPGGDS